MMARKVNSGYVLIFAAGMLWGTIGLFVKQMEECGSSSAMTSFLRVLFAALAMLPLSIVRDRWRSLLFNGKTLLYCALLGVVCHGVYNIFYSLSVTIPGYPSVPFSLTSRRFSHFSFRQHFFQSVSENENGSLTSAYSRDCSPSKNQLSDTASEKPLCASTYLPSVIPPPDHD